jgi:hypothetical protein
MFTGENSTRHGIMRMHAIACIAVQSVDDDSNQQKVGDGFRYSVIRKDDRLYDVLLMSCHQALG